MDSRFFSVCLALCVALLAAHGSDGAVLSPDLGMGASFPKALARIARSVSPSDTSNAAATPAADGSEQKVCHSTTPCGWAVYVPFTRRVDYFMKNTCECPKARECLRTDDDLSVSAYVYRCRAADKQDKQDS